MPKKIPNELKNPYIRFDDLDEYPLYRFNQYYVKDNLLCASDKDIKIVSKKNSSLSFYDVLCDIYNLGKELDECNTLLQCYCVLVKWLEFNYHPYNINEINHYTDYYEGVISASSGLKKYLEIDLEEFFNDICKLYRAVDLYICLHAVYESDDERIFDIIEQKKIYDPINFFDKYKKAEQEYVLKDNITQDEIDKLNSLPEAYREFYELDLMQLVPKDRFGDRLKNSSEYEKDQLAKKEFATDPNNDYSRLYEEFLKTFPIFKMELIYSYNNEEALFVPIVNNVFDIGWYALSKLMTTPTQVKTKPTKLYAKPVIAQCKYCGKLFNKTGRNQTVCLSDYCQKTRKRLSKQKSRENQKKKNITNP